MSFPKLPAPLVKAKTVEIIRVQVQIVHNWEYLAVENNSQLNERQTFVGLIVKSLWSTFQWAWKLLRAILQVSITVSIIWLIWRALFGKNWIEWRKSLGCKSSGGHFYSGTASIRAICTHKRFRMKLSFRNLAELRHCFKTSVLPSYILKWGKNSEGKVN